MITINNKFELGQEVYIVQKTREERICPACDGAGHKIIDGHKFSCVEYYGTGKLHGKKKIYTASRKDKIDKITIHVYYENGELKNVIKYKFNNYTEFIDKRLFATKEEAIAACDRLNGNAVN